MNEFIIKNGFISKDNSQIIGSLSATTLYGDGSNLTGIISGSIVDYPGGTRQTFTESLPFITTVAGIVDSLRGRYFVVYKDTTVVNVYSRISAAVAGNHVVGIYETDKNNNFYPSNLIVQTVENDNGITAEQFTTVNQTLTVGIYFVASNTSSTATFFGLNAQSCYNVISGVSSISSSAFKSGLSVVDTYSAVMPAVFPAGAISTQNQSLPFIQFSIS